MLGPSMQTHQGGRYSCVSSKAATSGAKTSRLPKNQRSKAQPVVELDGVHTHTYGFAPVAKETKQFKTSDKPALHRQYTSHVSNECFHRTVAFALSVHTLARGNPSDPQTPKVSVEAGRNHFRHANKSNMDLYATMADGHGQGLKRPGPTADGGQLPEQANKKIRHAGDSSLATHEAPRALEIPQAIAIARDMGERPFDVGVALGTMLSYIFPLVATHLEHAADFQNSVPEALVWATGFVEAVDGYTAYLRRTDVCADESPSNVAIDCQGRPSLRKYMERYAHVVATAYKDCVRRQLCQVFQSWSRAQTQLFNKGVDKAVSGAQWVVYPRANVVLQAGDNDWAIWLRGLCEELGIMEARAGRRVREDM